jgi:hypothetical protein
MATYTCFTRAWYRIERDSLGNKKQVPYPQARRSKKASFNNESAAREYCQQYNDTHKPGPTSIKCEYTSDY